MNKLSRVPTFFTGLFATFLVGLAGYTLFKGFGYYLLSREARELSDLHDWWAPGGSAGVGLGILGTSLMIMMLSYTVRRKLGDAAWLGSITHWLWFHIVCGIMGPVFIILHTAFIWPRGFVSVGFWCMVLVATSGTFGRYIYGFFPRMAGGQSLAWDDAMEELKELRAELVLKTADSHSHQIGEAVQLVQEFNFQADHILHLFTLNREINRRDRQVRSLLKEADLARPVLGHAIKTLTSQLSLKRGVGATRVAGRLFRYWHLFHRPLASAMYVIISIHILGAILLGGSLNRFSLLFG